MMEIEKDLLTIPEFAAAAGKKKQGIYEQAKNENSKLFPFVVSQGSKILVRREALKVIYGIDQEQSQDSQAASQAKQAENQDGQADSQEDSQVRQAEGQEEGQEKQADSQESQQHNQDHQAPQDPMERLISYLEEELKKREEELKEKDRQLADRDKQISGLILSLQQAQTLHSHDKLLLEEYRKKEQEPQEVYSPAPSVVEAEVIEQQAEDQEPKKKRGFWAWLLGGG